MARHWVMSSTESGDNCGGFRAWRLGDLKRRGLRSLPWDSRSSFCFSTRLAIAFVWASSPSLNPGGAKSCTVMFSSEDGIPVSEDALPDHSSSCAGVCCGCCWFCCSLRSGKCPIPPWSGVPSECGRGVTHSSSLGSLPYLRSSPTSGCMGQGQCLIIPEYDDRTHCKHEVSPLKIRRGSLSQVLRKVGECRGGGG